MLISILYSVFFLLLNLVLYSTLTKAIRISRQNFWLATGVLVFVTLLHIGLLENSPLMPSKDYWDILIFSFSLVIIHFGSGLQKLMLGKFSTFESIKDKGISNLTLKVFDVLRYKVIYIMISIYQLLAVWIPEVR